MVLVGFDSPLWACGSAPRKIIAGNTTMVDIAGSSDADDSGGRKENFIGTVIRSNVDCDCDACQKGDANGGYESDIDHLCEVEPHTQYENNQSNFSINISNSYGSKWMVFIGHLENIHGPIVGDKITSAEDLCSFLNGRTYEWEDIDFTSSDEFTWEYAEGGDGYTNTYKALFSDMTNVPNNMIVPVREVEDDELTELQEGEVGGSDVEEVEL